MTEVAPTSAFGTNGPTIRDPAKRCPKCKYSLCGLPCQGRCPECGLTFEVAEPDPVLAVPRFRESFPWVVRSLLLRKSMEPRSVWKSLFLTLFSISVVSSFFVWGQLFSVRLAIAVNNGQRWIAGDIIVAQYRSTSRREPVRIHGEAAILVGGLAALGQFFLAVCFFCWYASAAKKVFANRALLRKLGGHAMVFVPLITMLAILPIVVWQAVNVSVSSARSRTSLFLRLPWPPANGISIRIDTVQLAGFAALVIGACVVAVVMFRCNRNAIRRSLWALGDVRTPRLK